MNIEKLLTDYLEYCEIEKNLAQGTIKMYDYYLRDFLAFSQKKLSKKSLVPKDIKVELIRAYRLALNRRKSSKSREELKRSTQKNFLVSLRAFLRYLIIEREMDVLIPEKITLGKSEERIPKFLDDDQLSRLMEAQNLNKKSGVRDRAILELLFSSGLRVSELVNLNREDINLKSQEFAVRGKGGKVRTVYISDDAKKWLTRYLALRKDEFIPLFLRYGGKSMDEEDYEGESLRLTPRSIQRMIKKYALKAGISIEVTPHVLRHTFATDLLRGGADLRSVQELLGHKNLSTTQIYTHVTNPQLREVHHKFHRKGK